MGAITHYKGNGLFRTKSVGSYHCTQEVQSYLREAEIGFLYNVLKESKILHFMKVRHSKFSVFIYIFNMVWYNKLWRPWSTTYKIINQWRWALSGPQYIIFGGLEMGWPLLCLCPQFCIFERCLYSNPESCRCKQARHLSP